MLVSGPAVELCDVEMGPRAGYYSCGWRVLAAIDGCVVRATADNPRQPPPAREGLASIKLAGQRPLPLFLCGLNPIDGSACLFDEVCCFEDP